MSQNSKLLERMRLRLQRVWEHRPQKLFLSVNGTILGTLNVQGENKRLTVFVANSETINFVEVFSEQNIRLSMLNPCQFSADEKSSYQQTTHLSGGHSLKIEIVPTLPASEVILTHYDSTPNTE